METGVIHNGDCIEVMRSLPDCSVDAVVCDPPAGIAFMGKDWDKDKGGRASWVAWMTEVMSECKRVLKPGGHALVWALPRTSHWTAWAVEDAGFECRDCIYHIFGSGFPKSLDVSKKIDQMHGAEREVGPPSQWAHVMGAKPKDDTTQVYGRGQTDKRTDDPPATPDAQQWGGWGTALKPAVECWWLARKPICTKNVAANVLQHGTGALNIGACRVETDDNLNGGGYDPHGTSTKDLGNATSYATKPIQREFVQPAGRWPANLILDEQAGALLDQQSGVSKGKVGMTQHGSGTNSVYGAYARSEASTRNDGITDTGGASRFFYCAKASRKERNAGLESTVHITLEYMTCKDTNTTPKVAKARLLAGMDQSQQRVIAASGIENNDATAWSMMLFGSCTTEQYRQVNSSTTETGTSSITPSGISNWLMHLLTSAYTADVNCATEHGGSHAANAANSSTLTTTINDHMASALGAANAASGTPLKISVSVGGNIHSTVKPLSLMMYLCRLVTPPGGVILDPFAGSGSTCCAAVLEGFNYIGIDQDAEYCEIARRRVAHWCEVHIKDTKHSGLFDD